MLKFKEYSQEFDEVVESIQLTEEEVSELNEVLDTAAQYKEKTTVHPTWCTYCHGS